MAKFKFQLEAVEKVRIQKEQKMLEDLAVAQRNYLEKVKAKRELLAKKQDAFVKKNELVSRDASINDIRLLEEYIIGLKQNIIRADQAIVRSRRFLEQAMRHYIAARKERMMVDKLKEKALEEFKLQEARLEQKRLDDLITMRARLNHGPIEGEEEIA
ncbi:MAG: flagellar export protein FliJ [Bdellovibrionales bacterium]|nr:flagellar export protein FliJ [Bdellovibrionales bacterium]